MSEPTRESAAAGEDGQRLAQKMTDETPTLCVVRAVTFDDQGRITSHRGHKVATDEDMAALGYVPRALFDALLAEECDCGGLNPCAGCRVVALLGGER